MISEFTTYDVIVEFDKTRELPQSIIDLARDERLTMVRGDGGVSMLGITSIQKAMDVESKLLRLIR